MNLNKIEYPVFKVSIDEVIILQQASKIIGDKHGIYFLCSAAQASGRRLGYSEKVIYRLIGKIITSIDCLSYLGSFLRIKKYIYIDERCYQARKIWIKQILKHNGYSK